MLRFLTVWLHILAAVIWIGGMLFISLVAVPVLRQIDSPLLRSDLFRAMARRFRQIVWLCIGVLILTGVGNLFYAGTLLEGSAYVTVLGIKLALVAVLIALGVLHDFVIGPRAGRAQTRGGPPPSGTDLLMVALAPWVGRLNLLLGIVILVLAAALTRSR